MTQEEKAKAYDEAREKIAVRFGINVAEEIFSEFEDSEDERIRKAIHIYLDWLDGHKDYQPKGDYTIKDMIAWLEKQEGCEHIKKDWLEHIKQSWYREGFIDGKYSDVKGCTINDDVILKELIDFLENRTAKLQHDLTRYANWLKIKFTPKKHLE